jgi:hypothetical protein
MAHVIIRGDNGRHREVSLDDSEIAVSLHASEDIIELAVEADDPDRPVDKRRFILLSMPRHLFSKAMADLARQDRAKTRNRF